MVAAPTYALICVLAGAIWVVWRLSATQGGGDQQSGVPADDVELID